MFDIIIVYFRLQNNILFFLKIILKIYVTHIEINNNLIFSIYVDTTYIILYYLKKKN